MLDKQKQEWPGTGPTVATRAAPAHYNVMGGGVCDEGVCNAAYIRVMLGSEHKHKRTNKQTRGFASGKATRVCPAATPLVYTNIS